MKKTLLTIMCIFLLGSISVAFASEAQLVVNPLDQAIIDNTNNIANHSNDAISSKECYSVFQSRYSI
ncbi:MAG: Tetratricopeptide repeat-containing protein [Firmicutes bacterium]|nr:Tetratricopeptide repeat-containing protein [Bacillota bacterium]